MKRVLLLAGCVVMLSQAALADAIWQDGDGPWIAAWQSLPEVGANTWTGGPGGYLYFAVASNDAAAAFSPQAFLTFSNTVWNNYTLSFAVTNITLSMSYQVGFDEFDAGSNYLSSLTLHPQGTFVGATNYSLLGQSWNANTKLVRPKLTMNTGFGDQTLTLDHMEITAAIPEPRAEVLMIGAGLGLMLFRKLRGIAARTRASGRLRCACCRSRP